MKNRFGSLILILVVTCTFFMSGCKKAPVSVIGTWTFSNVISVGKQSTTVSGATNTSNTTITYVSQTKAITETVDTFNTNLNSYSLTVNIIDDGTYAMTEGYINSGIAVTTTATGTWEYQNNSKSNDNITFTNGGSVLLSGNVINGNYFGIGSNTYTISSLSSGQLILAYNTSSSSSTTNVSSNQSVSASVTFTR
jgi:hypothetical protein